MKQKLLLAVSAVTLTASIGAGATFALFSDSTNNDANTITAGTLCLTSNRNDGDTTPGPMFYVTPDQGKTPAGLEGKRPTDYWAPGDTHTRTLNVYNPTSCSTMDAWLTHVEAEFVEGFGELANVLTVKVSTPMDGGPLTVVAEAPLSEFLAGPVKIEYPDGSKIPIWLTGERQMTFDVTFDRNAGNEYQGKTLVINFKVHGEQMKHNP